MLKSEAAAYLAGLSSEENTNAASATNVHTISGEVLEDSANGVAKVSIEGMVLSEEDDQYISVDTVGGLKAGDVVTMLISGEDGHGMTPLAIGAVGSVDRLGDEVAQIDAYAQAAQSSALAAADSAQEAADNAEASALSALEAQNNAETSAEAAQLAQSNAQTSAAAAQLAQSNAQTSAEAAQLAQSNASSSAQSALQAQQNAETAAQSAYDSEVYARGALLGLSTVEDVVDVLAWLSGHSKTTEDTSVVDGKAYYVRDAATGAMTRAVGALDPSVLGWYEAGPSADTEAEDGKTYYELDEETEALTPVDEVPEGTDPSALGWWEVAATTDTSMDEGKDYYTVDSGTGVASPLDPSALGWWEMDDAVTQYLAAHLALTDHGLNLMVDGQSGYIHLGTLDGSNEFGTYIIGGDGVSEANFGVHTRIGREDGMHVDITSDISEDLEHDVRQHKLFSIANAGDAPVMYVEYDDETGESTVYMTNAIVVQDLRFGNWMWYERANGNMSVRWTGDDA